jgi:hypothetical protein
VELSAFYRVCSLVHSRYVNPYLTQISYFWHLAHNWWSVFKYVGTGHHWQCRVLLWWPRSLSGVIHVWMPVDFIEIRPPILETYRDFSPRRQCDNWLLNSLPSKTMPIPTYSVNQIWSLPQSPILPIRQKARRGNFRQSIRPRMIALDWRLVLATILRVDAHPTQSLLFLSVSSIFPVPQPD